jgi:hypothetical protein
MGKKVKITNNKGKVDTDTVHVSQSAGEEVTWLAGDSDGAIIVFASPDGSPFEETTFFVPAGGSVSSGPADNGQVGQSYKYIVVGDVGSNDPVVIIDN